ncbi:hypothetical protein [Trichocoleus desertorum]
MRAVSVLRFLRAIALVTQNLDPALVVRKFLILSQWVEGRSLS